MRQMPLTDDEVFERQHIRKQDKRDAPTSMAVVPDALGGDERVHHWQATPRLDAFGPCGPLGGREHRDRGDRRATTRDGALTPTGPSK